jgi:hypothetical protein
MQRGKHTFSKAEFLQIKMLTNEKVKSDRGTQKRLRAKIRRIGFYWENYSSAKPGYTVKHLEELLFQGKIKIVN